MTPSAAARTLGTSKATVLTWIAEGLVKPRRREAPSGKGFYWDLTPKQVESCRKLVRKVGRPKGTNKPAKENA